MEGTSEFVRPDAAIEQLQTSREAQEFLKEYLTCMMEFEKDENAKNAIRFLLNRF